MNAAIPVETADQKTTTYIYTGELTKDGQKNSSQF